MRKKEAKNMRRCLIKGQEIKKDRKGIEGSIRLEQNKWLF